MRNSWLHFSLRTIANIYIRFDYSMGFYFYLFLIVSMVRIVSKMLRREGTKIEYLGSVWYIGSCPDLFGTTEPSS